MLSPAITCRACTNRLSAKKESVPAVREAASCHWVREAASCHCIREAASVKSRGIGPQMAQTSFPPFPPLDLH